jgi:hypothetical protein
MDRYALLLRNLMGRALGLTVWDISMDIADGLRDRFCRLEL